MSILKTCVQHDCWLYDSDDVLCEYCELNVNHSASVSSKHDQAKLAEYLLYAMTH